MKYICGNCGLIFDEEEIATWKEDRGEFWGQRAYETMYGCPQCFDGDIEEYHEPELDEDEERDEDDDG